MMENSSSGIDLYCKTAERALLMRKMRATNRERESERGVKREKDVMKRQFKSDKNSSNNFQLAARKKTANEQTNEYDNNNGNSNGITSNEFITKKFAPIQSFKCFAANFSCQQCHLVGNRNTIVVFSNGIYLTIFHFAFFSDLRQNQQLTIIIMIFRI